MSRRAAGDLAAAAEAAAASGYPALQMRQVGKIYGSGWAAVHALRDVDLEVWPGQFVVMLGPSATHSASEPDRWSPTGSSNRADAEMIQGHGNADSK